MEKRHKIIIEDKGGQLYAFTLAYELHHQAGDLVTMAFCKIPNAKGAKVTRSAEAVHAESRVIVGKIAADMMVAAYKRLAGEQ